MGNMQQYVLPAVVVLTGALSYIVGDWFGSERVGPAAGLFTAAAGTFASAYFMSKKATTADMAGLVACPVGFFLGW